MLSTNNSILDIITGTDGNDILLGTDLADIINAKEGNDAVFGAAGNDNIFGAAGNDILDGGIGNDTISGGLGEDVLNGGSGDDSLSGDLGNDSFIGTSGTDTINGGDGIDRVTYNTSNQITLLSSGVILKKDGQKDQLINIEIIIASATATNNTIDTSTASQGIFINANLQTQSLQVLNIPGLSSPLTFTVKNFDDIVGTSGNDSIIGDEQNNILSGGAGNDTINGGANNDTIKGGTGNDSILGGTGNDLYKAELGNDFFNGGDGKDTIDYSGGNQKITLSSTGTIIKANGTKDQLLGVENITANATVSNNTIDASTAIALVYIDVNLQFKSLKVYNIPGTSTNPLQFTVTNFDDVIGSTQNDKITGDIQANYLSGGAGNDTLSGGVGNDILVGGLGTDVFSFNKLTDGIDFIKDFSSLENDTIQVSKSGFGATSTNQFAYNTLTGALSFNGQQFVTLDPSTSMGFTPIDITLV